MKNKENTTSILDNIRKKMQKIEEKKVSENIELGDEFEYIDKATKQSDAKKMAGEIINDSKNKTANSQEFVNESEDKDEVFETDLADDGDLEKTTSDKHNFLYEAEEDHDSDMPEETEHEDDLELESEEEQEDDLGLGELDDLEEEHHEDEDHDDLDLDDLDLEEEDLPMKAEPEPVPPVKDDINLEEESLDLEDDLLKDEFEESENDGLDLDDDVASTTTPEPATESSPVVNSVYAATANEIISGIKSTDNQKNNMISGKVVEEATNSINKLIEQVAPKKSEPANNLPKTDGSKTIEDLVIEMLRPGLEQWLNANLPAIVERVVSEEIKKIVPKQ